VNGQLHTLAALLLKKETQYKLAKRLGGPHSWYRHYAEEKNPTLLESYTSPHFRYQQENGCKILTQLHFLVFAFNVIMLSSEEIQLQLLLGNGLGIIVMIMVIHISAQLKVYYQDPIPRRNKDFSLYPVIQTLLWLTYVCWMPFHSHKMTEAWSKHLSSA
jgi:hypothetical protein